MLSFRVSSVSEPGSVAGALAGGIRSAGEAVLVTIGAGALNQAVKAVVIASDFLHTSTALIQGAFLLRPFRAQP